MVLDNTFSMQGDKLDDLKDAADDLVDVLLAGAQSKSRIGLVPFSQYVNVGKSRRSANWIDVAPDSTSTDPNHCYNTYPDRVDNNCKTTDATCYRDGVSYSCQSTSCDTDLGEPVEVCEPKTTSKKWNGCVGSRNNPNDENDGNYDVARIPGLLDVYCTSEITPLTDNDVKIRNEIAGMNVQGSRTYIPAGLMWGLRLISSGEPFTEGKSYGDLSAENGVKALVLMTDGANTASATYPEHAGSSAIDADNKVSAICNLVKSEDVQLYTIAFEVIDVAVKTLMENCATSSDHYFDASDGDELSDAFTAIGINLTELALTK